ncbi:hypothetical protein [Microvirga aerophila]|nr:hypothetical protein [Microvirga aerophila]
MSKQSEWTIKGGIIGGLFGVGVHLVLRTIFWCLYVFLRFWYITLPLIAYFYIAHKVSYWWNNEAERDAIYASFQADRVTLSGIRPIMTTSGIRFIEFDINNNTNARVFQVKATCTYEPEELRNEDFKINRIHTEYAFAEHIKPGESKRVRLPLEPNGYLWQAKSENLTNLRCEPHFDYEVSDLFRGDMKKWRLGSQMEVVLNHVLKPRYATGNRTYVEVEGRMTNNSTVTIGTINVLCDVTNNAGFTDGHGKHYRNLDLKPGQTMSLDGRVTEVTYKPVATLCRVNSVREKD